MDEHRYSVWVPGNCASVRLAKLLASDTVVMKLVSPEIEWYYPLLQPGRHYLPVWVKGKRHRPSRGCGLGPLPPHCCAPPRVSFDRHQHGRCEWQAQVGLVPVLCHMCMLSQGGSPVLCLSTGT